MSTSNRDNEFCRQLALVSLIIDPTQSKALYTGICNVYNFQIDCLFGKPTHFFSYVTVHYIGVGVGETNCLKLSFNSMTDFTVLIITNRKTS